MKGLGPFEYSTEDRLKDEIYRLNQELLQLKRRYNGLHKKCKYQKRIMTKQANIIRQHEQKDMYINVQKGVKRKGKKS